MLRLRGCVTAFGRQVDLVHRQAQARFWRAVLGLVCLEFDRPADGHALALGHVRLQAGGPLAPQCAVDPHRLRLVFRAGLHADREIEDVVAVVLAQFGVAPQVAGEYCNVHALDSFEIWTRTKPPICPASTRAVSVVNCLSLIFNASATPSRPDFILATRLSRS